VLAQVVVRVVVRAGAVRDLPARMAALDLNGRVPDIELGAESLLEVAHQVLGL
jgi:hypothetical protein